jgi:biotin carboxyl carrier protein
VLDPSTVGIVRQLLQLVSSYALQELEVATGQLRVHIRRSSLHVGPAAQRRESAATAPLVQIASPLAGVFYRRPAPDAAPYVEVGQWVEAGQTVGLVEGMKVFNEITTDWPGRVAEIFVDDAQLVEAGQRLMCLELGEEEGRGTSV